jgi:hypothetical protein
MIYDFVAVYFILSAFIIKCAHRILIGLPFGRQPLEKFKGLEVTFRMDLMEISFKDARWMKVVKDYVK